MGEAAKPQLLLVLWHYRVSRGSCKLSYLWGKLQNVSSLACFVKLTSPYLYRHIYIVIFMGKIAKLPLFYSIHIAIFIKEVAKPRSFCCAHVAVSTGEVVYNNIRKKYLQILYYTVDFIQTL